MGIRNCFKKNKGDAAPSKLEISNPISQNYEYGDSIPPWLNNYADLRTVEVESYVHPARDDRYFDAEKRGFAALQTFGPSTTWVQPKDNASVRSSSSSDDGSIAILASPPPYNDPAQPERRGLRQRLHLRNKGLNADGSLRDEYDDLGMPDWGMPDEYAAPRRHFWQ